MLIHAVSLFLPALPAAWGKVNPARRLECWNFELGVSAAAAAAEGAAASADLGCLGVAPPILPVPAEPSAISALQVLLTPSREAAYRRSRQAGFSCTPQQPLQGTPAAAADLPSSSGSSSHLTVRFVPWRTLEQRENVETLPSGGGQRLRVPLPVPFSLLPEAKYSDGSEDGDSEHGSAADQPFVKR